MDLEELMSKAVEAFAKSKFEKAAKLYADYCKKDPDNFQARLRLGDAWARSGDKQKAIAAYQVAAIGFAKTGQLPRAIATSKLILELDPHQESVQRLLTDLYARREESRSTPTSSPSSEEQPAGSAEPEPSDRAETAETTSWFVATRHGVHSTGPPAAEKPSAATVARVAPQPQLPKAAPPVVDLSRELPPELQVTDASQPSLLQAVEGVAAAAIHQATASSSVGAISNDPAIAKLRGVLPNIPLFSDLDPNPFTELIQKCPLRIFGVGDRVFAQGSRGDAFYIICSGGVKVVREVNGSSQELARLQEGSFFGEMAIVSDAPRVATVESIAEDTQLLEISADVLKQLTRRYPGLAQALTKFCRQRMLQNVMNGSLLFRPFNKQERRELIERFRSREVGKDTVILREGEHSDGLYVVLSGEVEVRRGNAVLARLKEGDLFGEMSLLNKSPTVASVISTRRTSLLRLPRPEFDSLIMSHPQILELVSDLTHRRTSSLGAPQLIKGNQVDPILV